MKLTVRTVKSIFLAARVQMENGKLQLCTISHQCAHGEIPQCQGLRQHHHHHHHLHPLVDDEAVVAVVVVAQHQPHACQISMVLLVRATLTVKVFLTVSDVLALVSARPNL